MPMAKGDGRTDRRPYRDLSGDAERKRARGMASGDRGLRLDFSYRNLTSPIPALTKQERSISRTGLRVAD